MVNLSKACVYTIEPRWPSKPIPVTVPFLLLGSLGRKAKQEQGQKGIDDMVTPSRPMYVRVYVYIYIYTSVHIYRYVHTQICVYIYTYTYVYTPYTYIIYVYGCVYVHASNM